MNALPISNHWMDRVLLNEPMSKHTSWRVGGPADIYFVPRDVEELQAFLAELDPETPITWVGLGSNMLVRDGGIRGAVISVQGALGKIERLSEIVCWWRPEWPAPRLPACAHAGAWVRQNFSPAFPGPWVVRCP